MKKFFKILRKFIKFLLKSILWLILGIIIISGIILLIINNRTLKFYENGGGNMKFTMDKEFIVKEGFEVKLNLNDLTYTEKNIYSYGFENFVAKLNLKNGIIKSYFTDENGEFSSKDEIDFRKIFKLIINREYIEYYENGQIKEEGNYINGRKNGIRNKYYENGQVEEIFNYKDGNKNGYGIEYYKNGNVYREGNYKDWSPNGIFTGYYENGSINYICKFKNGMFDGKSVWYENDGYYADIEVNNGIGNVLVYDENNNIKREYGFITDNLNNILLLDGNYTQYFEGGEIFEENNYKNGKYDGVQTGYYNDGSIRYLGNYKNGIGIISYFDEDGNLIGTGEINFTNNFEDGNNLIETYKSVKKGLYINSYDNGQIFEMLNYKDGKLEGIQTGYYENEQIASVCNYIGGLKNGECITYHENGQIREIGEYKNKLTNYDSVEGYKNLGKYNYYNENGNFIGSGEVSCAQEEYNGFCMHLNQNGLNYLYYPSYKIKDIYYDKNGIYNYTGYFENGNIKYVGIYNYTGDVNYFHNINGNYIEYYENGNIKEKYNYLNGKLNGYGVEYFEDGKIYSEGNYDNGKRVGVWNRYLGDGSIGVSKNYDE